MPAATRSVEPSKVAAHMDTAVKSSPKIWLSSLHIRRKVVLQPLNWNGGCWFNWLQHTYFEEPAGKVLSLSCGSGHHERRMAQVGIGKHIVGIDSSKEQLARARADGPRIH